MVCGKPETGPSTLLLGSNDTSAHYSCRAGYRLESGNLVRWCDTNGTWTGAQPVCAVDSILPKAYLVILIVGATIAVFLACIPYDFYRFRKRKKKVRDHQERLSLVTRIAPGHAKVVVETIPAEDNAAGNVLGRKFGFKSLFSVFKFVGGKMKSPGHPDSTSPMFGGDKSNECDHITRQTSLSDAAPESDAATTSSYVFSPKLPPASASAHDVIDFCSVGEDKETFPRDLDPVDTSTIDEDDNMRPRSSSPLVFDSNDAHVSGTKKAFLLFKKAANEKLVRDVDSHMNPVSSISRRSVPNAVESLLSEPATVEVTSMNESPYSAADTPTRGIAQDESPPSEKPGYSSSSTSSLDVTPLRKADTKGDHFRTFHYPKGKNSVAYHSMPTITDIP